MPEETYYMWNCSVGGWLTKSATFSSEIDNAKIFTYDEALTMTRRHFNKGMAQFGLIPVNVAQLEEARGTQE